MFYMNSREDRKERKQLAPMFLFGLRKYTVSVSHSVEEDTGDAKIMSSFLSTEDDLRDLTGRVLFLDDFCVNLCIF